jgi:uncharacterized repeat protein (TIGR03803 family)
MGAGNCGPLRRADSGGGRQCLGRSSSRDSATLLWGTGDGSEPEAGLIADSSGNLYGTTTFGGTSGIGTVFKLAPPTIAGGAYT